MKITKFLALILVAAGLSAIAPAAQASPMTRDFIRNATVGNGFEIMSSRIALQRSQNPEVRDFAQRMIDDHRRADEELRSTIMSSRYAMRGMPNNLDGRHRAMLNQLQRAQGPRFDRLYVRMQTQGHDEAVRLFSNYARGGDNPALRDYAARTLPTIEEHEQHIRQIRMGH